MANEHGNAQGGGTAVAERPAEHKAEQKEKKTLLQEFKAKYETVRKLADTIEIHHFQAYTDAATSFLKDKEGNIDYKKLKDSDVRTSMADKMADFYISKAKQYFKVDESASKLSDMQKEMLMHAYAGITRGTLQSEIHKAEDEFTLENFKGRVTEIKRRVASTLIPSSYSHISESAKHKKEIIKDIGLEGKLDPELVQVEELFPLMEAHNSAGVVSPRLYEKLPAYKASLASLKSLPEHKAELKKYQQN